MNDLDLLIESYEIRLKSIKGVIKKVKGECIKTDTRLKPKADCYQAFLTELNRIKKSNKIIEENNI
jgi:hypothetical protein